MQDQDAIGKAGQRAALLIVAVAVFWLGSNIAGGYLGWTSRTQALFDLVALAGFGAALWFVFNIWRARRNDRD